MQTISIEQSGAFIEKFTLPPTKDGPLRGLRFAVKDLIDVAGHRTGCGNPTWLATHPPANVSAVCVEQLLAAGAQCEGKTITDEFAFSLLGRKPSLRHAAEPGRARSSAGRFVERLGIRGRLRPRRLRTRHRHGRLGPRPGEQLRHLGLATVARPHLGRRRDAVCTDARYRRRLHAQC